MKVYQEADVLTVLKKCPAAVVHLRRRFQTKRFGLVLGSGVSRDFNIPDWDGLIKGIAQHPAVRGDAIYENEKEHQSLAALVDLLRHSFESRRSTELKLDNLPDRRLRNKLKGEWLNLIRQVLYEHSPSEENLEEHHPYLAEFLDLIIDSRITVNYNFDSCIETMIDYRRRNEDWRGYDVVHDIPIFSGKGSALIYHPNGFLPRNPLDQSSTRIVFSEQEFGDQLVDSISGRYSTLSHHLSQNTCLLLGLSIRDETLRHLLRRHALFNPGHYHYSVNWIKSANGSGEEQELNRVIYQFRFETYNIITLFLTSGEIAALGKLIRMEKNEFQDYCCEIKLDPVYVYYVTGIPGAGKTSTINYMQNLETIGEWAEEPLPELAIPFERLTPQQTRTVNEWIARQFALKNSRLQKESEGIFLVDRCPLDPLTFTTLKDRPARADDLRRRILEESKKGLKHGKILMLTGDSEELSARLAIQKPDSYSPEALAPMQEQLKAIYQPYEPTAIDTTGLSLSEVVKRISQLIHNSPYVPSDLGKGLKSLSETGQSLTL